MYYCRFDMVLNISIVNIYKYQNVFKSIPALSWLGKTILMPNYWLSRSSLRWMSAVLNCEIWNMVLLSTFGLLLTCFLFWIFYKFEVCMIGKNYCILTVFLICIHKQVKLIIFTVSIKFCDESGLAILTIKTMHALRVGYLY